MTAPFQQRLDDAGRAALREVAPDIVTEFRGEHNRKLSMRKEMRWGSKGSLSLAIAGSRKGLWFDHETGRGGDIIEFIKSERGCSFVDALDHAAQYVSELRNGHAGRELLIGEGIETTLSASMLGFGSPAWSVIDAGEMSRFPALPGISRLTIAVDHDVKGAGEKAAAETKARWEAAGLRVRTVMPPEPGHDLNDVLSAREGR